MLRALGYDLVIDVAVSLAVLVIQFGTFSGVMAATVAGLLTSLATSGAKHPGLVRYRSNPSRLSCSGTKHIATQPPWHGSISNALFSEQPSCSVTEPLRGQTGGIEMGTVRSEMTLYHVLERLLKETEQPVTCVDLYDHPEVSSIADTVNKVSDTLGHLWRKGYVQRHVAPKRPTPRPSSPTHGKTGARSPKANAHRQRWSQSTRKP